MILILAGAILIGAGCLAYAARQGHLVMPSWLRSRPVLGFAAWTAAGALSCVTIIAILSLGIFILPFAVLALCYAIWRFGVGSSALGSMFGAGLTLAGVGLANLGTRSCSGAPAVAMPGQHAPGACGGPDGAAWLTVGLIIAVAALATTIWVARRRGSATSAR